MSRGPAPFFPGFLLRSKTQKWVASDLVRGSSASNPLQSLNISSTGLGLLTLKDEILKFLLRMVLMVELLACQDVLVPFALRFCRVPCFLMDSKLNDGASSNSMPMTIILSRDGWLQINGRPGFSTTRNARLRRRLRTTSSSFTNVPVGLAAIGEVTTLVW